MARLIRSDGSNYRRLPTSGMPEAADWMTWSPAWGPDRQVAYAIVGSTGEDDYPYDTPIELRVVTLGQDNEDTTVATVEPGRFIVDIAW